MNSNRGSVAFPIAGLLLILLLSYGMPAVCDARTNSMRYGPFFQKSVQNRQVKYETSSVKLVWVGLMNVYARVISPADGPRSPSYPTGSAYGKQAIRTYGFFLGVQLTSITPTGGISPKRSTGRTGSSVILPSRYSPR